MGQAALERGRESGRFGHAHGIAAMPSAILTKSMPGSSRPGTLRTCITWLNERIAP